MHYVCLVLSVAALFLVACTVPGPSEPLAQIASQRAQWLTQNIKHYRLSVMQASIWHAQTNTLTVRDGQVTDTSAICTPSPMEGRACQVQPFDAEQFTIDGLFDTAAELGANSAANGLRVTFDETYHYPAFIARDNPEALDDEMAWRVVAFEPLP